MLLQHTCVQQVNRLQHTGCCYARVPVGVVYNHVDSSAVSTTLAMHAVCNMVTFHWACHKCGVVCVVFAQVCRLSVAAMGLLQHSQDVLGDEATYAEESSRLVMIITNQLSVLHRVACEQPGMIPQVCVCRVSGHACN